MLVDRFRNDSATRLPISTMNKRVRVKGIQRHLSATGQSTLPSGVMQAVLMHALQLRRSCREVFLLCDIQRHSISEAAEILGISRAATNRRLKLARQRMNEVIERLCAPQTKPAAEIKLDDANASCGL
jgi:DNA-directed RNA polymerase specialized sigma24 family protein